MSKKPSNQVGVVNNETQKSWVLKNQSFEEAH